MNGLDKVTTANPDHSAIYRDSDSSRRMKDYLFEEGRTDREKNRDEHEELRVRVAALESEVASNRETVLAARDIVAASKLVKSTVIFIAVVISLATGALAFFDRFNKP